MKRQSVIVGTCVLGLAAMGVLVATGQPTKDAKPGTPATKPATPPAAPTGQPEMKLPPGWTSEDMEACMIAGTPGKQHEFLAKQAGTWTGKSQMWMGPGMEVIASECTQTVTVVMDGRYIKTEIAGDMPGMGPFTGLGFSGFDNVSEKYVGTWIDNHSTGIWNGTGVLAPDQKSMTWTYNYNCPVTKKPTTAREVATFLDATHMKFEMFAIDPKSNKEYKCMQIDYTKAK